MDGTDPRYEPGNPVETAELFAEMMNQAGYELDFSTRSLEKDVDRLLRLSIFHHWQEGHPSQEHDSNEAALSAYIGETLCRQHDGQWRGEFFPRCPIMNFYRSFVQ